MKTRKRGTRSIDSLPYDSWCSVITFYEGKEEFLSLIFSVKGLFEYINRIIPQCTENIEFNLKKLSDLPTKPRRYVTSLSIGDKEKGFENLDSFLNTLPSNSTKKPKDLKDLFLALSSIFPNVLKLNFNFRRIFNSEARNNPPMIAIPPSTSPSPFLKVLKITISQTDLTLFDEKSRNGYLKNLEELALINVRSFIKNYNGFYRRELSINFQSFTKIKKLELCGWDMKDTSLLQMKNLRTLFLESTSIEEESGGISNVEELYLASTAVCGIQNFQNIFKNIKKLTISPSRQYVFNGNDHYLDEIIRCSIGMQISFELKNFQFLEEIEILKEEFRKIQLEGFNSRIGTNEIEFIDLPKLRRVIMKTYCSNINRVIFRNTPSLEYLDYNNTPKDIKTFITLPELPNGSSMKKICLNNIHLNSQSIKSIQNYKELQELKILGSFLAKEKEKTGIFLENMPELRKVEFCKKINLIGLRNCEKLEKLDFFFHRKFPIFENIPQMHKEWKVLDGLCYREVTKD